MAKVDTDICDGTGACVEACGYDGAIRLEEREVGGKTVQRAVVNEARCAGCGACAAVCPTRAIQVAGWTLEQFDAVVDAIMSAQVEV